MNNRNRWKESLGKVRKKMVLSAGLLVMVTGSLFAVGDDWADRDYPFEIGERLTYSLRWGIIRAGTAVLEVHPMTVINGEEHLHFSLSIRTTSFVDRFYKVRDRIDGFAKPDLSASVLYKVKKDAGKNLREIEVAYDPIGGYAQYSNFGEKRDPIDVFPRTLDPLSVLFAMRATPLETDTTIELAISDGKRVNQGEAKVLKKKTLTVAAGKFRTYLTEPDMKDVGGVFDKAKDSALQVYFSDDKRQLPIRISSAVAVGKFHAELISIEKIEDGEVYEHGEPVFIEWLPAAAGSGWWEVWGGLVGARCLRSLGNRLWA